MTSKKIWANAAVLSLFAVLAVLFTYPLIAHFATDYPGLPTESQNNPWNMWHFRNNIAVLHENPLWSDYQFWPLGANLLLHHYTLFNDALAFYLLPVLGLEATHNLLFISFFALSGFFMYLFLRDWKMPGLAAFAGGFYFAFSPVAGWHLTCGQGMEFVSLWVLPLYLWALSRAIRDQSLAACVLAALALSIEFTYNYYYFMACCLLIPFLWAVKAQPLSLGFDKRSSPSWAKTALSFALAVSGVWMFKRMALGQFEFHGSGSTKQLVVYVLPYILFWGVLACRLALAFKPRLRIRWPALSWRELSPYAAVSSCWAALNWPMIGTVVVLMATGDYGAPQKRWRGGGNPIDLATTILPSEVNPLTSHLWTSLRIPMQPPPMGFVALVAAVWLWSRRSKDEWLKVWTACFAFFFLLMLGPWLKLFGEHMYLPLPFYFLHLLPVFSNFPNGQYFNACATLFLAPIVALACKELEAKKGKAAALALLGAIGFESLHGATPLYKIEVPPLVASLRERPNGAVLSVPVSAMFHLTVPYGYVGKEFFNNMMAQVINEKPSVGGTLSRSARRTYDFYMNDPMFSGLLKAQDGAEPGRLLSDPAAMERFFRDWRLRYVIEDEAILPASLKEAMKRWPMREVERDGPLVLYEVR